MSEKEKVNRFTPSDKALKVFVLFVISVLSFAIMLFGKIPGLQIENILEMELSDVFVLVAYSLYGFFPAVFVILFKTTLVSLCFINTFNATFPAWLINTLISSLLFLITIAVINKMFDFFKQNVKKRVLGYLIAVIALSLLMTVIGYFFILPSYDFGSGTRFTFFSQQFLADASLTYSGYLIKCIYIYLPFYIVEYITIFFIYEIVFKRYIYTVLKSEAFNRRQFMSEDDFQVKKADDLKNKLTIESTAQMKKNRALSIMKKKNAVKMNLTDENVDEVKDLILYRYDITVDKFGYVKSTSILSDDETSSIIVSYMQTFYPNAIYKIKSYKSGGQIIRNHSTDGIPASLFMQVNHCTSEITKILDVKIQVVRQKTSR